MPETNHGPAEPCPVCAMLRQEVADWRRRHQDLLRGIAETARAGRPLAELLPPPPPKKERRHAPI
jgi:hypothetical protein